MHFNFWGAATAVTVSNLEDEQHLLYYFQEYAVEPQAQLDVQIRLAGPESESFTNGTGPKQIWVKSGGYDWIHYETYTDRSTRPTPLPPFTFPPLSARVKTIHASAAATPDAPYRAVVFLGESTVGKSALLLTLLKRGWRFITDDTAVVTRSSTLLRYCRPIGVREETLQREPWLRAAVSISPQFQTFTGTTHAVNPRALHAPLAPDETPWDWTVQLHSAATFEVSTIKQTMSVQFDVAEHSDLVADAIEGWTLRSAASERNAFINSETTNAEAMER
jgi:hypothetical protein